MSLLVLLFMFWLAAALMRDPLAMNIPNDCEPEKEAREDDE